MTRYVLILALLASWGTGAVHAQTVTDWFAAHGKGKLEYKCLWHEGTRPQDSRKHRSEFRLTMDLDVPLSDEVRLFVSPDLRWDSRHMSAGMFDEGNRDEVRRPLFHFKEAFAEWHHGPWDLRVGEQIFAWGTADGYNPTDNLNPRDYLDLVDSEKIPVFALSATYHVSDVTSLQFVLVPYFTPSRFDGQDSRWSFFPLEPALGFERDLPGFSLSNMQWAVRAKTSTDGWDFSLSYFDGYNDIGRPSLRYGLLGAPLGPTMAPDKVHFDYDKVRILGIDFATTWNDLGIHGEVAHTWTDGRKDDSYLQYVFGIDYTFADIRPGQNLRLLLEYADEHVTRKGRRLDGVPPTRLGRHFDGSILARAVYEFNERAHAELKAVANLSGRDNFHLQPSLTLDVLEDLRLIFGLDLFFGRDDTFLGQFKDNSRLFLILDYYF